MADMRVASAATSADKLWMHRQGSYEFDEATQQALSEVAERKEKEKLESLREKFTALDLDKTQGITKAELGAFFRSLGFAAAKGDGFDSFLTEQFAKADVNDDGKISFGEFMVYHDAVMMMEQVRTGTRARRGYKRCSQPRDNICALPPPPPAFPSRRTAEHGGGKRQPALSSWLSDSSC